MKSTQFTLIPKESRVEVPVFGIGRVPEPVQEDHADGLRSEHQQALRRFNQHRLNLRSRAKRRQEIVKSRLAALEAEHADLETLDSALGS